MRSRKKVLKRKIDKRSSLSYNVRHQIGIITENDGDSLGLPLCDHLNCTQASHTIHPSLLILVNRDKIRSKAAGPRRWRQTNSDGRTRRALERRVWANFVLLPARVRQRLLQTFMREAWNETADDTPEWRFRSRRQLKYGGNKWCAEFANNLRPVSTTWPWNIRPSLAVLWGVCWMFYPQQGDGDGQQQQPQRQRHQQYGWQAGYGINESILTSENLQQLTPGTYCTAHLNWTREADHRMAKKVASRNNSAAGSTATSASGLPLGPEQIVARAAQAQGENLILPRRPTIEATAHEVVTFPSPSQRVIHQTEAAWVASEPCESLSSLVVAFYVSCSHMCAQDVDVNCLDRSQSSRQ